MTQWWIFTLLVAAVLALFGLRIAAGVWLVGTGLVLPAVFFLVKSVIEQAIDEARLSPLLPPKTTKPPEPAEPDAIDDIGDGYLKGLKEYDRLRAKAREVGNSGDAEQAERLYAEAESVQLAASREVLEMLERRKAKLR